MRIRKRLLRYVPIKTLLQTKFLHDNFSRLSRPTDPSNILEYVNTLYMRKRDRVSARRSKWKGKTGDEEKRERIQKENIRTERELRTTSRNRPWRSHRDHLSCLSHLHTWVTSRTLSVCCTRARTHRHACTICARSGWKAWILHTSGANRRRIINALTRTLKQTLFLVVSLTLLHVGFDWYSW